ncbi:cytochrome c5 family protein [Spongiibacter sp. KMU-158]|uniref:Cytochrome c5 family protein n=2 Tax=Spongiibacter pelagi TaxID=2760804 RepID=A0A927GW35_9GAMM|nr:cytochrome c5 family protein [Spongiibacter pelagi]
MSSAVVNTAQANNLPSTKQFPADPDLKALYTQSCYSCHAMGTGGAPRTGSAKDWQPRFEQGINTLLDHTIQGFKGMPPLGMCMDCGEEEFLALIEFMGGSAATAGE